MQTNTQANQPKENPNEIGSAVDMYVTSLPGSKGLRGKIDTGADISSLHADEIHVNNNMVTFTNKKLSPNSLTVPLLTKQAVRTADGGVEYRPVVSLNIKIGNKLLKQIEFNLNDRSSMEYPVLIGKNILTKGSFLINPKLDEATEEDLNNVVHKQTTNIYRVPNDFDTQTVNETFTQKVTLKTVGHKKYVVCETESAGMVVSPINESDDYLYILQHTDKK